MDDDEVLQGMDDHSQPSLSASHIMLSARHDMGAMIKATLPPRGRLTRADRLHCQRGLYSCSGRR